MSAPRLVFDVTTMLDHPVSGIPRVMRTVAAEIVGRDGLAFCRFDLAARRFSAVPADAVRAAIDQAATGAAGAGPAPAPAPAATARRGLERLVARRPATGEALLRAGYFARRAWAEARTLPRAWRDDRPPRPGECFSDTWGPDTVYCSLGLDHNAALVAERRAARGFRTVLTVYDLIPVVVPQFAVPDDDHPLAPDPRRRIHQHFTDVVEAADHLLVISEATRRDVEAFAAASGLALPPTSPLPLGPAVPAGPATRPRGLPAGAAARPFVLVVGTIEIRKNHHLLLDVWEQMLATRPRAEVPELVVVGRRGWRYDETYARLTRTPAFAGVVHHLEGATDAELAWCYTNAAFTCVPSFSEGWGLPVSESLAFGVPCLSSDASALPEAGQGLTDLLDPYDTAAWRTRILERWDELGDDPAARAARAAAIAARYRPTTTADTAAAVLAAVASTREVP